MRTGTLCLTAVVCTALVGCGRAYYFQLHPFYIENPFVKTIRCKDNQCGLSVTVTDCSADGGIQVTDVNLANGPDLNIRDGDPKMKRTITWTIVTDGYEFAKEPFKYGILIKMDPAGEFNNSQVSGDRKSLSIEYKKIPNSSGAYVDSSYTYGLQLRRTSGTYCALLDPWMIT
jgi:hypothetical protein